MVKYVNAETVKKELDGISNVHPGIISAIKSIIDDIPAENVEEVKHGKWIMETMGDREGLTCTNCQHRDSQLLKVFNGIWHYCPYCGAEMKRE